jgi:hypothetical protein
MHGRMLTRVTVVTATAVVGAWSALTEPAGAAAATTTLPSSTTTVASTVAKTAAKLHHATQPIGNPILGFPESWGLTRKDLLDIGAGILIALLLVVVLVLRVRRRHRSEVAKAPQAKLRSFPQTAEAWRGSGLAEEPTGSLPKFEAGSVVLPTVQRAPGWHPVQGDRTRLAYWDGSTWSAYLHWDGRQWVDPTTHLTPAEGR